MNVLWLPHAPWRTPQRARFFAEALSGRHTVHVTNYDAEFTRPAHFASRRYARNFFPGRWKEGGVTVHHVPRVSPALFSRRLRQLNRRWFAELLARVIERERIDVVVGTFVAPVPAGVPLVTDIFDDNAGFWSAYGQNKGYAQEIWQAEQAWVHGSRTVVTVSSVLAETVRRQGAPGTVVHIPNPVDLTRYRPDRDAARRALGLSPDAVYVGNIGALDLMHEARRVLRVAEALQPMPAAELLVVGRGAALPWLRAEVARRGLRRVRLPGFLGGDALLHHFQALDIGLCPYSAASKGDHARVPMRLLHYAATGAQVVCTRLDEVQRMNFPGVTLTDDTDEAFAAGVLAATAAGAGQTALGQAPVHLAPYDQATLVRRYEQVLEDAVRAGSRAVGT